MKQRYEKPMIMIEKFIVEQHIAYGCTSKPDEIGPTANFECGCESPGHDKISFNETIFTTSNIGCNRKADTLGQLISLGKELGNSSWNSDVHRPAMQGGSVIFNS